MPVKKLHLTGKKGQHRAATLRMLARVEPLLPAIHEAILPFSLSGEMFADEVRSKTSQRVEEMR